MILYFADRQLNILGQASTHLPGGVKIAADMKTEDIETGVAIFECDVLFDSKTRAKVEAWAEVGNYIFRESDGENELYSIIDAEIDTKKSRVYVYAEDDGLDLLNEVVEPYTADQYYPISHYVGMYAANAGWEIGINEVEGLTRKLKLDSEQTASARLLKIAEEFNGCELSFSFEIKGLKVVKKLINIYEKRGNDTGIQLRLNKEIDSIITTKSIANLATALKCTGGTPDNSETPITLKGYVYDDGDFYVEGAVLKSRKALEKWKRYLWKADTEQLGGHIVKQFSYDTTSQEVLCENAIANLKKICDMEVNYEVDITKFPEKVRIGDRVNIIDDKGNLYLSSRVLTLETSEADEIKRAIFGEHLIRKSGISEKVEELAKQFSELAESRVFYTWVAYADDDKGTGISLKPENKSYIGIVTNQLVKAVDISDPSIFAWSLIKGEVDKNTISQAISSLEVGGRNFLLDTATPTIVTADAENNYSYVTLAPVITPLEKGQVFTFSADVEILSGSPTQITISLYDSAISVFDTQSILNIENNRVSGTITPTGDTAEVLLIYAGRAGATAGNSIQFSNMKLEKGSFATDWTPAIEEVASIESVTNAQNSADEAQATASSAIIQLADALRTLVTDTDGASLMTQTANGGWTFSMGKTAADIARVAEQLALIDTTNTEAIAALQKELAELNKLTNYVRITTSGDQPCIELGQKDSNQRFLITNTETKFLRGSTVLATFDNEGLIADKGTFKKELNAVGVVFIRRKSNGRVALMWKGDAE